MATRCPNCTRKVRIWSNHDGFCSKRCREDSRSACLNCGKAGLFKHARLGCCSDECRYWYVTTMLGYDREYLLTPAWDKVVYHVRLPSASAEISSLQLDELEYERAHETILVVAAPAWIARQKVLAELPYQRFDNPAWQHLSVDGTLGPEEIERFRRMCYDDPLLYHNLGEHVFEKIRGQGGTSPITPSTTPQLAPGGVPLTPVMRISTDSHPMSQLPEATLVAPDFPLLPAAEPTVAATSQPLRLSQVSQAGAQLAAPDHFASQVRTLFALRNYQVSTVNGDTVNTLLLTKGQKRAVALFLWQEGMISNEPVEQVLSLMTAWEADHGYVVTNGHFTLQAQDLAANRPLQLIDGPELVSLIDGMRSASAPDESAATTRLRSSTRSLNGDAGHTDSGEPPTSVPDEAARQTPPDFDEEMLPVERG
ncbi:MAG: restriction endonuclease [Chloroflexota bacterium]